MLFCIALQVTITNTIICCYYLLLAMQSQHIKDKVHGRVGTSATALALERFEQTSPTAFIEERNIQKRTQIRQYILFANHEFYFCIIIVKLLLYIHYSDAFMNLLIIKYGIT